MSLLSSASLELLIANAILSDLSLIRISGSKSSNLVPLEGEETIHALETATRSLGNEEPSPETTEEGDNGEEPEGSCGTKATLATGKEHVGDSARVSVLVDEMEAHDHGGGDGTDAEGVDFSVEKVLHGVPAHCPTETTEVNHDDCGGGCLLLARGELFTLLELGNGGKESGDVSHGDGLKTNSDTEGALATNDIDQEESADNGGNELDDTKDGSCKQLLVLTLCTEECEELGCVDGDRLSAGPLGEELRGETEVDSVEVVGHQEHFLENTSPSLTESGFLLLCKLHLNLGNLLDDMLMVDWKPTDAGEVGGSLIILADLRMLVLKHET